MSKVCIKQLGQQSFKRIDIVISWSQYIEFAKQVSGEGVTWKAILV